MNIYFWIGFHVFILIMLVLDLGVLHKDAHKVPVKEAVITSAVWITLALLFNLFIFYQMGRVKALEFFTGYVIEYSLSVDNIFVFILIFSFFSIKEEYQHKVLFWGIIGALVMRGTFIFAGIALIHRFQWIVIIFGAFLVYTGVKMLFTSEEAEVDPEKNLMIKIFRKYFPVTDSLQGDRLFVRSPRGIRATQLFMVLLIIDSSDLIFAADSIPAILAISQDKFIVYTSNIFAILGLRSLYFAISGIMDYFRFLKTGLSFVLAFVGLKMVASFFHFNVSILLSLGIIISILLISIIASVLIKEKK